MSSEREHALKAARRITENPNICGPSAAIVARALLASSPPTSPDAAIRKVKIAAAILAYAAGSAIAPLGAYVKIPASLWSAVRALAAMEIDS